MNMAREIKFRAWASAINQMVYMGNAKCVLYGYDEGEEWGMFFPFKGSQACLSGYDSVMQYTGLKDKNGLEDIYEGDIIGIDGLKKGNVYENGSLLEEKSNLIIQGLGTSSWEATNKKAMERGCSYAE